MQAVVHAGCEMYAVAGQSQLLQGCAAARCRATAFLLRADALCLPYLLVTRCIQAAGCRQHPRCLFKLLVSWQHFMSCRYGCYLVFQLRTHHDLFCGDDDDEEPVMTFPGALAVLTGITVTVAVCSE